MKTSSNIIILIWNQILHDPIIMSWAKVCYIIQFVAMVMFKFSPVTGPWTNTAMSTAYQVNALIAMILQTYLGCIYWFDSSITHATSDNEQELSVRAMSNSYPEGQYLSQIVIGGLLESIPIGILCLPLKGSTLMHFHHIGMFSVCCLALGYFTMEIKEDDDDNTILLHPIAAKFAPFFFGVIEASSIPLVVVDMFHPHKSPDWHTWHQDKQFLISMNEISRVIFAVLYFLLRVLYFPYVVFWQVIPELYAQTQYVPENQDFITALYSMMTFAILFTLLQLYWGSLILQQVLKMLNPPSSSSQQKKTK